MIATAARRRPRLVPRIDTSPGRLLTHAVLLICGIAWVYPFLWALSGSLKTPSDFIDSGLGLLPKTFDWHNYLTAWTGADIGVYFMNTVIITVSTVILTLLFSSMAGYALARTSFPGRALLLVMIAVTFFLPRGYTIIPTYTVVEGIGLLNTIWSVVLVQVAGGMVFSTFFFMGYFRTVAREVEEAAQVDGASFHQTFLRIMVPMSRPMMATLGLFAFINSWNDFLTPLVFTLGNPNLRTLAVGMYAFISQTSTNWTALAAGSVITLAPIMIVFVFAQRHIVEAIAGAVKG